MTFHVLRLTAYYTIPQLYIIQYCALQNALLNYYTQHCSKLLEAPTSPYLEGHRVHEVAFLAKHELRTFVGKLEKDAHLVSKELEEIVSMLPAKDYDAQEELQSKTPDDWSPFDLDT